MKTEFKDAMTLGSDHSNLAAYRLSVFHLQTCYSTF